MRKTNQHLLNLRERTFKIEIRLSDLKRWHQRFKLLLFPVVVLAVLLLSWLGGFLPKVKADLAIFYPTSCLGGWENPQNAQGLPELLAPPAGGAAERFDYTNSAVLSGNSLSQLYCGGFQGATPEDAAPKKFSLKFSWTFKIAAPPAGDVRAAPGEPVEIFPDGLIIIGDDSGEPGGDKFEPPIDALVPEPLSAESPPAPEPPPPVESAPPAAAGEPVSWLGLIRRVFAQDKDRAAEPAPGFLEILYTTDSVNWQSLGFVGADDWRQARFEIPIAAWDDIAKLQVSVRNHSGAQEQPAVYLDGLWLEVEYEGAFGLPKLSEEELANLPRRSIDPAKLFRPSRAVFRADEEPTFELVPSADLLEEIPAVATSSEEATSTPLELSAWWSKLVPVTLAAITDFRVLKAELFDPLGEKTTFQPTVNSQAGKTAIVVPRSAEPLRPGKYRLRVEVLAGEKIFVAEQEFLWGVLAINTNKSIFSPGDTAYLQMAVLNDAGRTICDANLELQITSPVSQITILSTEDGTIQYSKTCGPNNVTDEPDYFAYYETAAPGRYELKFTNLDNGYAIDDSFAVRDDVPFDVERVSATRINPFQADYWMTIKIKANEDFVGEIIETVPESFKVMEVESRPKAKSHKPKAESSGQEIIWQANLKQGESVELRYQYRAPPISPRLWLLGPLNSKAKPPSGGLALEAATGETRFSEARPDSVASFVEARRWQIAADVGNACQSFQTGNWSAASTWTNCGGTTPQSADTVTILNTPTHTVTLNTSATIQTIDIQNGGTLTNDGNARTLTLSGTTGTLFTLGGTFTPSTYISVVMNPDAAVTLTSGAITFYNLTLSPILNTNRTYTFGSGALTINGDFTINPSDLGDGYNLTVNMGANITVAVTKTTLITRVDLVTSVLDTRPSTTDYNLSTGFLDVAKGGTLDAASSASVITLTGTTGTLFTLGGTFTQGASNVTVTSASGTPTLLSAATTFHKLTINSAATVINMGAFTPTINNASGAALDIQAGVFNASGDRITGPGATNGTLTIASGATLCLGGTTASTNATCNSGATDTTARSMPTFQTYTFNAASTVRYLSNAAQTVSQTPTYGNLILNPTFVTTSRTYTLGGAMTINGDFTINPDESSTGTPALTVNAGGNITVASGKTTTITRTNSATSSLDLRPSTTDYNLTTGGLTIAAGGTLDAASAASVITVSGNYTNNGTFTAGSSTVSLNGAATQTLTGTMTGSTGAFYNLTITNSSGTAPSDCEITGWAASVDFAGSASTTNNYTITTASVKVEYNSASLYTFQNINWNGQATTTPIYFRNSAAPGSWLLYVPGTQTAVSYVNVSRSDASGSSQIDASNGTNTDCGNNVNWDFPYLYFSVDSTSQAFPTLTPGTLVATTSILTVRTNNSTGFYITLARSDSSGTMKSGTIYIPDKTDWIAPAATTTAGNATASTTDSLTLQFRIRLAGTDTPNYASAWWGSDDTTANALFAGIPLASIPPTQEIIIRSTPATATTTAYVLYNVNVPSTQQSGDYSGGITYTATANP